MKKISIVSIGGLKEKAYQDLIAEYQKRLSCDIDLKLIEVPAKSFSKKNHLAVKKQDTQKILEFLQNNSKGAKIFFLTEDGATLDSLLFSQKIFNINEPLVFVIGGALGFDNSLIKEYPKLSLSKMTFLHEMAKLILVEQIYRANCIFKGKTYHY